MKYLLRLEAVNLAAFVSDCKDLNTIRGGGLLLLDAAETKRPGLEPISTGASVALYEFEADDDESARQVRARLEEDFTIHDRLKHATFAVDCIRAQDFKRDREALVALNRFRQMRSPSVAYPDRNSDLPCKVDGIRPATEKASIKTETVRISGSVSVRHAYGKAQKRRFYERVNRPEVAETRIEIPEFVYDLSALAEDESQGNLNGKVAVIHIDGNRFGTLQSKYCGDVPSQRAFDKYLKIQRLRWLRGHLDRTMAREGWFHGNEYRFETLLWGGDEVVIVVPAWQGWDTLRGYFEASKDWEFAGQPLTHRAGMVFCHAKASIHRSRRIAEELNKNRTGNNFVCQVMESFDAVPNNLLAIALPAESMRTAMDLADSIRDVLPRRKLVELVRAELESKPEAVALATGLEETMQRRKRTEWDAMKSALSPRHWLNLNELWDYLP